MTNPGHQIQVSYHQFYLVPFDCSPIFDASTAGPLLALDPEQPAAVIISTGCADGPVHVTVDNGQEPLPDLATAAAGWEVGEQLTITIDNELYLVPLMGGAAPLAYTPSAPGLHLIRVLARGRTTHYDAVVWEPTEDYEITITPVATPHPRQTTGTDGLYQH